MLSVTFSWNPDRGTTDCTTTAPTHTFRILSLFASVTVYSSLESLHTFVTPPQFTIRMAKRGPEKAIAIFSVTRGAASILTRCWICSRSRLLLERSFSREQ